MQTANETNRKLLEFIDKSPSCFHAVENLAAMLEDAGCTRLFENQPWRLEAGKRYFVLRNGSSLLAFSVPQRFNGMQIVAAHSDSPTFRVKTGAEITVEGRYKKLNTEGYGGMILSSWFDRPLSLAGRAVVRTDAGVGTVLVNIDRDLLVIPSLAIHMTRGMADQKLNPQVDLLPLFGDEKADYTALVAAAAGVAPEKLNVCAVFDNEEVGSRTKQGADSTFLTDTACRIRAALGIGEAEWLEKLPESFMLSADNAHAVHPNYAAKCDETNRCYLNGGIVVKYSANQKYTTDAVSASVFGEICRRAGVPVMVFHNRSDMAGGSTLGNIANAHLSLNTVDIGIPQLAMHACVETAGARDTDYMVRAMTAFYEADIRRTADGAYKF